MNQETHVARNFDGRKEEDKRVGLTERGPIILSNNNTVVPAYKKPYLAGDYDYVL